MPSKWTRALSRSAVDSAPGAPSPARRRLLGLTAGGGAAVVGGLLAKGMDLPSVEAQASNSIVGSWIITFPQNGPDSDPNEHELVSFTSDGIMLGTNSPSSPPDPQRGPDATRTYSTQDHGAWVKTGTNQVRFKLMEVEFDDQSKFSDLVQITGTGELSADGNSFTASFAVLVTGADGSVLFDSQGVAGTVQGTRIIP